MAVDIEACLKIRPTGGANLENNPFARWKKGQQRCWQRRRNRFRERPCCPQTPLERQQWELKSGQATDHTHSDGVGRDSQELEAGRMSLVGDSRKLEVGWVGVRRDSRRLPANLVGVCGRPVVQWGRLIASLDLVELGLFSSGEYYSRGKGGVLPGPAQTGCWLQSLRNPRQKSGPWRVRRQAEGTRGFGWALGETGWSRKHTKAGSKTNNNTSSAHGRGLPWLMKTYYWSIHLASTLTRFLVSKTHLNYDRKLKWLKSRN